jgi:hypothetical protein
MSTTRLERHYHCWNDCVQSGCPGHTATLEYQSGSDSLHFQDGRGHEIYMQTPELEAFLLMLHELGTSRVEIGNLLSKT